MPSKLEAIFAHRDAERRAEALPRAIAALEALREQGVDAGVIGSLARDRMRAHSDVDFVILDRGPLRFNDVLRIVDEKVSPVPWDVIFLDRVEPEIRASFTRELRRAPDLRQLATAA
jgi:predicted nucleotidyltransferase